MRMINLVEIQFKMQAAEAIKSLNLVCKFAIAPVEIHLERQPIHHHAVARIFMTGLRNLCCTLP